MKFNINEYKGKYVMHCETKEEAKDFCEYLKNTANIIIGLNPWCISGNNVYFLNKGTWCDKAYAISEGYTVLEWSSFANNAFTKENLKTGDVIKRRNGCIEIVNLELGMFILKSGWNDLNSIRSDLTCKTGEEYDIVAVRRPKTKGDCQFDAFEYKWGTLVYERKEVEEMTLEQVCKLLGKEIKIIK
jgi:hypothetical protein